MRETPSAWQDGIMMDTTSPLHVLKARARRLLTQYRKVTDDTRTPLLRSLAETLVEMRSHFQRADGTPDWKGRSHAYRNFIHSLYADAGFTPEETATIQAAVRYHVGAVLRDHLDADTLVEYGLIKQTPRERSSDRRQARTALYNALAHGSVQGGALMSITAALNVLARIERSSVADLAEDERMLALRALTEVERESYRLRQAAIDAGE